MSHVTIGFKPEHNETSGIIHQSWVDGKICGYKPPYTTIYIEDWVSTKVLVTNECKKSVYCGDMSNSWSYYVQLKPTKYIHL